MYITIIIFIFVYSSLMLLLSSFRKAQNTSTLAKLDGNYPIN